MALMKMRRGVRAVTLSLLLVMVLAVPVLADPPQKDGTTYCSLLGYLHARYYDWLGYIAPGTGTVLWDTPYDYAWHVVEHNGAEGGGYWYATGDNLDLPNTHAGCRNYG